MTKINDLVRIKKLCISLIYDYLVKMKRFHIYFILFSVNFINWNKLLEISFACDFIFVRVILRLTNRISCSQFQISRLRRFSVSQFHSESSQKKLKSTLQWWFQPCKPIIHIKSVTITEQNHLTNRFCHFQTTEFKINTYG